MLAKIKQTAKWLEKLEGDTREKVEYELDRQKRALEKYLNGKMPKRTAKRIIWRSSQRVAWIVAGGDK
jgi:hypothetical protein